MARFPCIRGRGTTDSTPIILPFSTATREGISGSHQGLSHNTSRMYCARCSGDGHRDSGLTTRKSLAASSASPGSKGRMVAMGHLAIARRPSGRADQPCNSRNAAQVVEIHVLELDAQPEFLLDLQEQLHNLHRVEQAAFDQVRVGGGDLDVQLVEKERVQPRYHARA